VFAVIVAAV